MGKQKPNPRRSAQKKHHTDMYRTITKLFINGKCINSQDKKVKHHTITLSDPSKQHFFISEHITVTYWFKIQIN